MTNTEFNLLQKSILEKLENELPEHLFYHSSKHTKRIVERAEIIANYENVSGRDLLLVKIAALFHDIGFLKSSVNHEEIGCEMVKDFFNQDQLQEEEIERICGMIMATKIPQTPHNLLEEIIADADLEYIGTDDFERIGAYLFKELKFSNPDLTEEKWDEIQVKLMENHRYFTSYGQVFLTATKRKHLIKLKENLSNSAIEKSN